jgi:hypothetical protein
LPEKFPETLEECFEMIINTFPADQIEIVKNSLENKTLSFHRGLGLWMRNKWMWNGQIAKLQRFIEDESFVEMVVSDIDDWKKSAYLQNIAIEEYIRIRRTGYHCCPDCTSSHIIKAFILYLNGKDYSRVKNWS